MTRRSPVVPLGLVAVVAFGACAPASTAPAVRDVQLPRTFEATGEGPSAAHVDWRAFFADETLSSLVTEALANNLDLQIALQRVEIARATARGATGALLPQIAAVAGASATRFGRYTVDGSGAAETEIAPGRLTPNPVGELMFGLEASWEVDAWGKLRGLRGAARTQYLATIEAANLVITGLVAEVASTYVDLLALDHVRDVLRETIAQQTQALEMIRAQKEAGRANELAVQQFEAQLANTHAMNVAAAQRTTELENRLAVLLGRLPSPVPRAKEALLREVAPTMAAGVPSELLRSRPDIREAELSVQASRFDLTAARAAFYPSLTITANAGYSAYNPRYLVSTPQSIIGSLVGNLVAPLVNRRALEAELAVAEASQLEAIYRYQRVVLEAFAEVATGLAALTRSSEIVEHRRRKKEAVADAVEAADALFRAGKATYLEVLLAQQNTLDAELELIEALRDRRVASIALYRALGGGWRGELGATAPRSGPANVRR